MAQVPIPIAVTADDTAYGRTDTVYPPVGTEQWYAPSSPIYTVRSLFGGSYVIRHLFLRFNTGANIPAGAIPRAATLRVYVEGRSSQTTDLGVVWDWHNWTAPPTSANYSADPLTTAYSTPKTISTFVAGATFDFVLENAGQYISTTGYTGLRSHVTQHPADAAPIRDNSLGIASIDNTSGHAAPTLIVDYEVPQSLAPNAIISRINLPNVNGVAADDATALAAIDDDPANPDALWLTAP